MRCAYTEVIRIFTGENLSEERVLLNRYPLYFHISITHMDAVRLFQVVAYPQTRLDVHYPVPRERHLYQPSGVLAAPVVYEPRRAFVGTDHIQRDELRSALCGHLLLEHIERQSAEDILRPRPDLGDVRVELINVELPREVRYLLLHELIARRDNRRADTLLIAAAEQYLLVARDESMRDDVLDSEDVPQRVGNGLAVVAVRVDERDSTELLARELLPERIYRVHELPAEPEQRGDAVLERVPLFQLRLHLLVELRPLLVHAYDLRLIISVSLSSLQQGRRYRACRRHRGRPPPSQRASRRGLRAATSA